MLSLKLKCEKKMSLIQLKKKMLIILSFMPIMNLRIKIFKIIIKKKLINITFFK